MRDEYTIPPLRDLPGDRLAERKNHLVAELAPQPARRLLPPRVVVVLAAGLVIVVVATATAFGTVRNLLSSPRVNSKIAYIHKHNPSANWRHDPRGELWVMKADGSGRTRLSRIAYLPGMDGPSWSPDATRIAFNVGVHAREGDIYVVNVDGSGQRRLARGAGGPRWSPDGRKIMFTCLKCGEGWEVYVMNADGSGQRNLTRDARVEAFPAWSPDGRKIAFTRLDAASRPEVVVMNADGSGKRSLSDGERPVWSPDGRKIAFTKGRADALDERESNPVRFKRGRRHFELHEIYVMNADGSEQRRLTRNELPDGFPQWSPDGRKIVFLRGGFWKADLYLMNADGSGQRRLAHPAWSGHAWSPDGRLIAFTRGRGFEVSVVNADGSGLRDLTHSRTGNFFGSWSPGRRGG